MKRLSVALFSLFSVILLSSCNDSPGKEGEMKDSAAATSPAPKNNITDSWKIGPQFWTFNRFSFTEAVEKTDSAGLKSVEVFWGQPLGGGSKENFGLTMSPESRAKIKSLLQSKGIQIVAMGVIVPKTREEWLAAFEFAKEFGLSYVTAEPKKNQWDMIDSLAGQFGIKVAIHDHPKPSPYWHPDSVLAAAKGHPNIGSCADIGHWARSGLDPVECLKKLEGHVYGVHLKDITVFGDPEAPDTVVSKGIIKYPEVFAELKRQNFNGMFSIEQESNWLNNVTDVISTAKYFHAEVAKLP